MKKILFFTVLVIAIFSMIHSIESVYSLWKKRDIIVQTQQEVKKEEEENKKLKQQLQTISSPSYVEEEARNKLFMVKSGEKVVFIPASALATRSGEQETADQQLSPWEQWFKLFSL